MRQFKIKKKLIQSIVKLVNKTNIIELQIFRYWAENTEGIIIKTINGFVIPPVKNKNKNLM